MIYQKVSQVLLAIVLSLSLLIFPVYATAVEDPPSSPSSQDENPDAVEPSDDSDGTPDDSEEPADDSPQAAASATSSEEPEPASPQSVIPQGVLFNGSAGYSIPIEVPPSRLGIGPQLSLTYSSSGRNGLLGVGWNLDLGSIQRSTKNGVNYSADDYVASINGVTAELVPAGNNIYRCRKETVFHRFFKNPDTGKWKVTTKEGINYFYGTNAASRQTSGTQGTFRWYLDRVEDLNGNFMEVVYNEGSDAEDEKFPAWIIYTGYGQTPGTNSVRFLYEARDDEISACVSQVCVKTTKRLRSIEVRANGALVRTYVLRYEPGNSIGTGRSLLSSVSQYGYEENTSQPSILPPIRFSWHNEALKFRLPTIKEGRTDQPITYLLGDVNGDGRSDLIEIQRSGQDNTKALVHVFWSDGTNFVSPPQAPEPQMCDWITGDIYQLGDFNGDGKVDIAYFKDNDAIGFQVMLGNGRSFNPPREKFSMRRPDIWWVIDLNNDGLSDLFCVPNEGTSFRAAINNAGNFSNMTVWAARPEGFGSAMWGDVNGDGLPDLACTIVGYDAIYVYINGGNAFLNQCWEAYPGIGLWGFWPLSPRIHSLRLADMNGDGFSDLVYFRLHSAGHEVRVLLSNGTGFMPDRRYAFATKNVAVQANINPEDPRANFWGNQEEGALVGGSRNESGNRVHL